MYGELNILNCKIIINMYFYKKKELKLFSNSSICIVLTIKIVISDPRLVFLVKDNIIFLYSPYNIEYV